MATKTKTTSGVGSNSTARGASATTTDMTAKASNTATGQTTGQTTGKTTTKKELIDRIADETGLRRADVKQTVQAFLDHVIEELGNGNRLEFRDFGVFEIKDRAPRLAQNPKTLERVHVPAKRTVKFKVGRLMKQSLDGAAESDGTADRDRRSGSA